MIDRGVIFAQARGVRLTIHIGTTVFYFGSGSPGLRIELFTPRHCVRVSKITG
jgi:hypothetical protein